MSRSERPKIPVNIISGPLGVGKTTTINHLLKHRPPEEKWAILVNEYGLVGLDAALMASPTTEGQPKGVHIKEVAGGCICCSAGFMFEMSLVLLLQRRPDRLIIEPTGLAAISGILDTLERKGICEAVDVQSIICLVDPRRLREDLQKDHVFDQVAAADILLASRADLAPSEDLERFHTWAGGLFPPKHSIGELTHGNLSTQALSAVSNRVEPAHRAGHTHGTDHHQHGHDHGHSHHEHGHDHGHSHHEHGHDHGHSHHEHGHDHGHDDNQVQCSAQTPIVERSHRSPVASTLGWICFKDLVFDAKRASCWLNGLSKLPGAKRTKAVLHTNEGWWSFNFADGIEEMIPSGYRRDSRLEVIFDGDQGPDSDLLEAQLRDCLVDAAAKVAS